MRPENLICEIKFGSHLYGTQTEQSDEDFKGIFLPTKEEILLGRIPRSYCPGQDSTKKNAAGELDCEYMSLHRFLDLAIQGQTMAIDMLFAPDNMTYLDPKNGWIWKRIQQERGRLLSKNMRAFIGYARGQATKYSLKGDRLAKLEKAKEILCGATAANGKPISDSIEFGWFIEQLKFAECITETRTNPQGIIEHQIGGKWYGEPTQIKYVIDSLVNSISRYGTRSHEASEAGGVDWKALSHAVRVSKELIEIICFGSITFPLVYAPLILRIKKGEIPLEEVQSILDTDLAFIELKMPQSLLPAAVDGGYWDEFLYEIILDYVQ